MKSPQKRQGPTPERGHSKKRSLIDFSSSDREENDADSSGASTIILHQTSGSSSDDGSRSRKLELCSMKTKNCLSEYRH